MKQVPEAYHDLLDPETKAFAFLATLMPDGSPQVTPLWFSVDDDFLYINTAEGRVKDQNMRARPEVALAIINPDDPYRYLQIRGEVVEIIAGKEAREHIDTLSHIYRDRPYDLPAGQTRVIYKIKPYD